jgi:lipopolysaccharide exporter
MSLKKSAASGIKWTGFSTIAIAGLQFIQLAVLARLLSPEAFGLVAMIMVILGFAQAYADMGISNAIIHRQDTTKDQLSSLYWLNILAGILVFLLLLLSTPLVVTLYREPRLAELMQWAALIFLITPLGQQFQILLQKELQFKTLSIIEMLATLIGTIVAVLTVMNGQGVLSLIWGQLTTSLIKALMLAKVGWKRWQPRLRFKYADLHGYIGFGLYQMGERSINYFNSRLDQLLIGVLVGAQALGYYNLAFNLVILPASKINAVIGRVAFPLFAKIQFDNERLKRGYLSVIQLLSLVNFPLLFGLAVVAPIFVPLVFGEQWLPAVVLVQILSFVALLRSIINPVGSLLLAKGRADLGFNWNLMIFILQVPGIFLGGYIGGVLGIALAVLGLLILYSILNYLILIRILIGSCLREYIMSMIPAFSLSLLMASIVTIIPFIINQSQEIVLISQIIIGIFIYLILNIIFQKQQLLELLNYTKNH